MQPIVSEKISSLEKRAAQIRLTALEMIYGAGSGHPGPCLSCADILAALYFDVLRINPQAPKWPARDRFILSKGHAAPSLYAALHLSGYFPSDDLKTFRQVNSRLQGHPDMKMTPGVEMTSGALGNGLSLGAGMALAARLQGYDYRTYVLLGDGECQEGQVWEAAAAASTRELGNLIAIVDRNKFNQTGPTENCACLEPFADRWKAFCWRTREVDGHDIGSLLAAFQWAGESEGEPSVIIASTIKGRGVSFIEGKAEWHAKALSDEQMIQARKELSNGSEQ
jgi:transketolase